MRISAERINWRFAGDAYLRDLLAELRSDSLDLGSRHAELDRMLSGLRNRDDAEFLLKRMILTGTVARVSLRGVAARTNDLLAQLAD